MIAAINAERDAATVKSVKDRITGQPPRAIIIGLYLVFCFIMFGPQLIQSLHWPHL